MAMVDSSQVMQEGVLQKGMAVETVHQSVESCKSNERRESKCYAILVQDSL